MEKKFYTKEEALKLINHDYKVNKNFKDFTGHKYEQITVLGRSHKDGGGRWYMWVECSCGNCFQMRVSSLKATQSCGCMIGYYQKLNRKPKEKVYDNLTYKDAQFGILKMSGEYEVTYKYSEEGMRLYECNCVICGNKYKLGISNIKVGFSQKCECWKEHAVDWIKSSQIDSNHHLYKTFIAMHSRCYNQTNPAYSMYGAKGVTVCDEWEKSGKGFTKFLEDMLPSWKPNLSLHRVDNVPLYSKDTCVWETDSVQCHVQKKRSTVNGKHPRSVFIGVGLRGKVLQRWCSQITKDGVEYNLGWCRTELAAAMLYDEAALEFYGEHANVNGEEQWEAYKKKVGEERAKAEMNALIGMSKEQRKKYVWQESTDSSS